MRKHTTHVSVRPYLFHALMATVWVLGVPFLALYALVTATSDPGVVVLLLGVGAAAAVAIAIGVALWRTRPQSADIAFGELLIWGWLQRRHAENRLEDGARLLGLDRSGHPTDTVRISPEHQLEVLHDLNGALEAKDPYTHGHSQRVERHAFRTAAAMGLSVSAIEELRLAAALHDVGKIRVPDRILRKPTNLTPEERSVVEDHVVVGAWMVSSVGSADVISAVRHHHERWDGRGYPDGLAGADIPLYARMIAVADAYDAITSTRPYRVSANREHAVSVLQREAGSQFDPMIVNAFVEALPVRLPVAGVIVLFAGPAAFGRRLAMWLKRLGAGHLAPAAATLGAMVALGAFLPGPALVPAPQIVAQEQVEPGGNMVKGDNEHKRINERPRVERSRTRSTEQAPQLVAAASTDDGQGDFVLGETVSRQRPRATVPKAPKPTMPNQADDPEPEPSREPEDPEADDTGDDDTDADDDDDSESGSESCSDDHRGQGEGHEGSDGKGHSKNCE
jgi:hypothetical protein